MPYIFATTLLLYKLDTLLLKQNKFPVLDITGFFFRMSTQVKAEVLSLHPSTHAEKETRYIQYGPLLLFHLLSQRVLTRGGKCLFPRLLVLRIRVITKLPNSEQSYKGKVKTHNYINRQNQSTTGKL